MIQAIFDLTNEMLAQGLDDELVIELSERDYERFVNRLPDLGEKPRLVSVALAAAELRINGPLAVCVRKRKQT